MHSPAASELLRNTDSQAHPLGSPEWASEQDPHVIHILSVNIIINPTHILLRSATYGNSTNLGVGRLAFSSFFLQTNKDSILCFYFPPSKGMSFCVPLLERSVVIWKNKSKLGLKCVLEIMCIFLDVSAFRWNCKMKPDSHTHTHTLNCQQLCHPSEMRKQ